MVALDPAAENDPKTRRWCYEEVIKQLLYRYSYILCNRCSHQDGSLILIYRYERELSGGKRPPLRLIATGDAPPSCPMTLCVSDIIWPTEAEGSQTESDSGHPSARDISSLPEIELTDGWYRLRAEIDFTLTRAIERGVLRIGRKISLATARVRPTVLSFEF